MTSPSHHHQPWHNHWRAASVIRRTISFLHSAHIRQCLPPKLTINISLLILSTFHANWPEWPFCLGEDILRTGAGTRYITITAWDPTLAYISLHQDTTLSHYLQPFLPDDIIDLEMCNVLKRCTRVGKAAWLLWKEIVLLFKACTPQWWQQWWGRDIWRVCPKYQAAEED